MPVNDLTPIKLYNIENFQIIDGEPFRHDLLLKAMVKIKQHLVSDAASKLKESIDGRKLYAYVALSTQDYRTYTIRLIICAQSPLQLFNDVNAIPKLSKQIGVEKKVKCSIACFASLLAQSKAASEMHVLAAPHYCRPLSADPSYQVTKQDALEILHYLNDEKTTDEKVGDEITSDEKAGDEKIADKKAHAPYIFGITKRLPSNRVDSKSNTIVVGEFAYCTPSLSGVPVEDHKIDLKELRILTDAEQKTHRIGSYPVEFANTSNELQSPEYFTLLEAVNVLHNKHASKIKNPNTIPKLFYYVGLSEKLSTLTLLQSIKTPTQLVTAFDANESTLCTEELNIKRFVNKLTEAGKSIASPLALVDHTLPITNALETLNILNKPSESLPKLIKSVETIAKTYKYLPFMLTELDLTPLSLKGSILKIPFYEFSIESGDEHITLFYFLNEIKRYVQTPLVQRRLSNQQQSYYYYIALSQESHETLHFNLILSSETPEKMLDYLQTPNIASLSPEIQGMLSFSTLLHRIINPISPKAPTSGNKDTSELTLPLKSIKLDGCDETLLLNILKVLNSPFASPESFQVLNANIDRNKTLSLNDIDFPIPSALDLHNTKFIAKIDEFNTTYPIKKINYYNLLCTLNKFRYQTPLTDTPHPSLSPSKDLYYYPFFSKKDNETLLIGQMISHNSPAELVPHIQGKKLTSFPIELQSIVMFASVFIQARQAFLKGEEACPIQKHLHHTQVELKATLDLLNDKSQVSTYSIKKTILEPQAQKPTISLDLIESLIPHIPLTKYQTFF